MSSPKIEACSMFYRSDFQVGIFFFFFFFFFCFFFFFFFFFWTFAFTWVRLSTGTKREIDIQHNECSQCILVNDIHQ